MLHERLRLIWRLVIVLVIFDLVLGDAGSSGGFRPTHGGEPDRTYTPAGRGRGKQDFSLRPCITVS